MSVSEILSKVQHICVPKVPLLPPPGAGLGAAPSYQPWPECPLGSSQGRGDTDRHIVQPVLTRPSNEPSRRFHKDGDGPYRGEGPYKGLLLVESNYYGFPLLHLKSPYDFATWTLNSVLNTKLLVDAFNQEKTLVAALSMP